MRVNHISTTVVALALSAFAMTSSAENANNDGSHNWMPKQPGNAYWQTPNWSGFNMPSAYNRAPPPPQNYNNYRPPVAPAYRQAPPPPNYPVQNASRPAPQQAPNTARGYNSQRPPGNYRGSTPPNAYRGGTPPPPGGPYNSSNNMRDNGASAYNIPGYNRNRNTGNRWGNMWGNNNNNDFWGRSGPSNWMNPNKNNMEQGWDDMINAPSRMGEMPGSWNAPEVSMPNPVDMGDQMQDNVQDLPEQMRDMDVGN